MKTWTMSYSETQLVCGPTLRLGQTQAAAKVQLTKTAAQCTAEVPAHRKRANLSSLPEIYVKHQDRYGVLSVWHRSATVASVICKLPPVVRNVSLLQAI